MSKLRQSVLEFIRTIGNHSGCHQLPERSFFYKGKQFPVCARCTGVTIGQITAVIIAVFIRVPINVSLGLLGLMGIDWGLQELHIKESSNRRRLLTGIGGGFGIFSLYITIFRYIFTRKKAIT